MGVDRDKINTDEEYLKKHGFITRQEYSSLTGLLKTKAANELRQWYNEKKIERDGRAPHIIYKAIVEECTLS